MEQQMDSLLQFRELILQEIETCLKEVSCQQKTDNSFIETRSEAIDKLAKLFINHRKGEDTSKGKLFDSILIQKLRDTQQHIILDSYSSFEEDSINESANQMTICSSKIVNMTEKFYNFLFAIFQEGIIDLTIIYLCVEELFQSIKTEDFSKLFFVLEDVIYKHNKGDEKIFLPLLRICNGILNKLSTTNHTNFIGRIHKLIADVFPLSHKSCVNFKGIYNQRIAIETTNEDVEMPNDEESICPKKEEIISSLSYSFYKNFWLLQKYISDPFQLFKSEENNDFKDYLNDNENDESDGQNEDSRSHHSQAYEDSTGIFSRFLGMIENVLDIFEKNPICENNESDLIEKKYPKYLAKYKLINLQFNDFQFRETFMIQILILFQSLKQPINEKQTKFFKIPAKKRLNKIKNRIIQIFNNILPQDQKEKQEKEECDKDSESSDIDEKKNTILNEKDSRLTKGITQILSADSYWSNWKQNKCKPYERNPSKSFISEIKRVRDSSIKRLRAMNEFKHGKEREPISIEDKRKSKYLAKFGYRAKPLTNKCQSGVMMGTPVLVDNKRARSIHKFIRIDEVEPCYYEIPTIGSMLEKVYCDMDPEEGVDDEYKSTNNKVFTWQLLRSIADNDLTKFMNKDYDIEQLSLEYLSAPYGLKELNYFVKSKKPEPEQEPEAINDASAKEEGEALPDSEIKQRIDKSEPRTQAKDNEWKDNSSSKVDDTKSNRESAKPSKKEERRESQVIVTEGDKSTKHKYKEKEKNKDRDHKSERHGREKGEYRETSSSHNPNPQDSKDGKNDHYKDNRDSKKEQRYSRQFEYDCSHDLSSDHRYSDNKIYDDNLVNQQVKRRPEKENTEKIKTERRSKNNSDFDNSKLHDRDKDYDKTQKNDKESRRDSNYEKPKDNKERKLEQDQKEERTPRDNQQLPQNFKPTKPIKLDKKVKDDKISKDEIIQRDKNESQNSKNIDSKPFSSKDKREESKGNKSNKYNESNPSNSYFQSCSNFASDKSRDRDRDQRSDYDNKQASQSNSGKTNYDNKHSGGSDRRDEKYNNEQRSSKYGDRSYRDDKR